MAESVLGAKKPLEDKGAKRKVSKLKSKRDKEDDKIDITKQFDDAMLTYSPKETGVVEQFVANRPVSSRMDRSVAEKCGAIWTWHTALAISPPSGFCFFSSICDLGHYDSSDPGAYEEAKALNLAFKKVDDDGVDGIDLEDARFISNNLGVGLSTDVEFINALRMTPPQDWKNKNLRGQRLFPRLISVQNRHCVLAIDKSDTKKTFFNYRQLAEAFEALGAARKRVVPQEPIE